MMSFRDNAWLAGFTDGEGCFLITERVSARENTPRFSAHFTIALRADDLPILEALSQALCAGRKFGAEEPVVESLTAAQLRLVS